MMMAENADAASADSKPAINIISEEMKIRLDKISVRDNAINEIVQRAFDRYALEMEAYKTKLQDRREQFEKTGQKPSGKVPSPPSRRTEGPGSN
jgi:hypothetical protein